MGRHYQGQLFDTITNSNTDQHGNATMINLSPQMMPVFAAVLDEPAEQLDEATRAKVVEMVKFIASKDVSLIDGNAVLMKYLGN